MTKQEFISYAYRGCESEIASICNRIPRWGMPDNIARLKKLLNDYEKLKILCDEANKEERPEESGADASHQSAAVEHLP